MILPWQIYMWNMMKLAISNVQPINYYYIAVSAKAKTESWKVCQTQTTHNKNSKICQSFTYGIRRWICSWRIVTNRSDNHATSIHLFASSGHSPQ